MSVAEQLHNIRHMPYGTARTAAAEAVARKIDAEGPRERLAEALLDLVEAYTFGGEGAKSFVTFARALRLWDASPELFDESDEHNLFWEFKWVAGDLADYPQITRAQAEAFLDDMQRRFELQGSGLSAVRAARFGWAWQSGSPGAEDARTAWVTNQRDVFDDCRACAIGRQTDFFVEQGRFDEALALGLTQDGKCNIEPAKTFHATALAALLTGDSAAALQLHRQAAASETSANRDLAASRGQSFELLARGGQIERALRELRGDYRELVTEASSPLQHLRFLLGLIAGLSANLDRGDLGTGIVLEGTSSDATVAELHAWATRRAGDHARALDARSDSHYYAELLNRSLGATLAPQPLEPVPEPAPESVPAELGAESAQSAAGSGTARNGAAATHPDAAPNAVNGSTGQAGRGSVLGKLWDKLTERGAAPAASGAGDGEPVVDAEGLLARAEEAAARKDYAAAVRDYVNAAAALESDGWIERAGLAAAEAGQCAALHQDEVRAHECFARAVPLLASGGADAGTLAAVLAAWAPVAARMNDPEPQITATAAALAAHGDFDATGLSDELAERRRQEWLVERATLRDTLARALAATRGGVFGQDLDSGRAAAEALRAGEEFAQLGMLADASHAFWLAGKVHVDRGDTEAAVWGLESAFEGFTAAKQRKERLLVAGELIELLRQTGQAERAEQLVSELTGG